MHACIEMQITHFDAQNNMTEHDFIKSIYLQCKIAYTSIMIFFNLWYNMLSLDIKNFQNKMDIDPRVRNFYVI